MSNMTRGRKLPSSDLKGKKAADEALKKENRAKVKVELPAPPKAEPKKIK